MEIEKLNDPQFLPDNEWEVGYSHNYDAFRTPRETSNELNQITEEFMKSMMGIETSEHIIHELRFCSEHMRNVLENYKCFCENKESSIS